MLQSVPPIVGISPVELGTAPGGKGPTKFADMGIPTAQAENKECVIM
jgi:hypothetical protein